MGLLGDIIGIGTSLLGGNAKKKAAKKAEAAQLEAARLATEEQRRQFDLTRSDNMPWLSAGQEALGGQMDLLGIGEGGLAGQAAAIQGLKDSPLFQSIYNTGEEAILANASATGGLRGGNTQNSLARFGGDTLSQVIQQMFANLGGISGTGNSTAATLGSLGQNTANAISGLHIGAGNARAGSALARGNITAGQWDAAGDGLEGMLSSIFGGGGLKF